MRAAEYVTGRRFGIVLDPGEEVIETLRAWCLDNGVRQAVVPVFFGAFRSVTLIGTHGPVADEEQPLPVSVDALYVEGVGSGSIALKDGEPKVHLHVAVGAKSRGADAVAGHVLTAVTHYTVEIVVDEVLSPDLVLEPRAGSFGLDCLGFIPPGS